MNTGGTQTPHLGGRYSSYAARAVRCFGFGSVALLASIVLSPSASAEEVVAFLDLRFIEDTGKPAAHLCFEESEDSEELDCVVWATLYLYQARVRKVISGERPSDEFLVLYGRHALLKKNLRRVVATLKKLEGTDAADADYQIVQMGERLELYCFAGSETQAPIAVSVTENDRLSCYQPE